MENLRPERAAEITPRPSGRSGVELASVDPHVARLGAKVFGSEGRPR